MNDVENQEQIAEKGMNTMSAKEIEEKKAKLWKDPYNNFLKMAKVSMAQHGALGNSLLANMALPGEGEIFDFGQVNSGLLIRANSKNNVTFYMIKNSHLAVIDFVKIQEDNYGAVPHTGVRDLYGNTYHGRQKIGKENYTYYTHDKIGYKGFTFDGQKLKRSNKTLCLSISIDGSTLTQEDFALPHDCNYRDNLDIKSQALYDTMVFETDIKSVMSDSEKEKYLADMSELRKFREEHYKNLQKLEERRHSKEEEQKKELLNQAKKQDPIFGQFLSSKGLKHGD